MKIEVLCGQGSPEGVHVSDIHGQNGRIGVGGAELALLTMCEGWAKAGHEVVLYNNPKQQDGIFEQRPERDFDKNAPRDIFIAFRQPTQKIMNATGKKIFWSCDQYTIGDFAHFSKFCDTVVTISPFHARYFKEEYGIVDTVTIDLPVRTWEYSEDVEKVPNRLVFTSVPDRGLWEAAHVFRQVREVIPDTTFTITSDYRLWGVQSPNNQQFVQALMRERGVQFLGAIPRSKLINEQQKAQIHLYPGIYDELFCIAVAESQVAGALPITSPTGALGTTNMGIVIEGNPKDAGIREIFAKKVVEYLQNRNLKSIQEEVSKSAIKRFSLNNIMKQWDEKVFK